MASYFKEIVENANKNGENIDMTQYTKLLKEYDVVYGGRGEHKQNSQQQQDVESLEKQVRQQRQQQQQ